MTLIAISNLAFTSRKYDERRQSEGCRHIEPDQDAVRRHSDWSSLDFTMLCSIAKPGSAPEQPGVLRHVEPPSALHYAAHDGDVAGVLALLANGADPNATSFFGMTPLHLVVREYARRQRGFLSADRWAQCTKHLLEAGANPMLRCHPNTTPAGMGEGLVPPALRDVMIAMAAEGVWLEDERELTQTDVLEPYGGKARAGDRLLPCHRISEQRLAELTNIAARMEREEKADRSKVASEHVRIGWWTSRKIDRHARAPKRAPVAVSKMVTA